MPMVSQLTTVTSDGRPSEDAQFDCVPASLMACVLCLKHLPGWTKVYNPDALLNKVYPEGYKGGTAASNFANAIKSFGVQITPQDGNAKNLISFTHKMLQQGKPVVFTEPDPYLEGWSHVCVFYGEIEGGLEALDPYIARNISKSDASWASLLQDGQVWVVELLPEQQQKDEGMYTIERGDTLSEIAAKHHTNVAAILNLNEKTLDEAARKESYRNSNNGNLIFPGTVIHLP